MQMLQLFGLGLWLGASAPKEGCREVVGDCANLVLLPFMLDCLCAVALVVLRKPWPAPSLSELLSKNSAGTHAASTGVMPLLPNQYCFCWQVRTEWGTIFPTTSTPCSYESLGPWKIRALTTLENMEREPCWTLAALSHSVFVAQ